MKKRYVLKDKKRFIVFISISLVITLTTIINTSAYGYKEPVYKSVTVKSGDTLWDIAKKYKKDNEDIRKYIYKVIKINNLESSNIYEGIVLQLPVG